MESGGNAARYGGCDGSIGYQGTKGGVRPSAKRECGLAVFDLPRTMAVVVQRGVVKGWNELNFA